MSLFNKKPSNIEEYDTHTASYFNVRRKRVLHVDGSVEEWVGEDVVSPLEVGEIPDLSKPSSACCVEVLTNGNWRKRSSCFSTELDKLSNKKRSFFSKLKSIFSK